jgi:hypothetical protein
MEVLVGAAKAYMASAGRPSRLRPLGGPHRQRRSGRKVVVERTLHAVRRGLVWVRGEVLKEGVEVGYIADENRHLIGIAGVKGFA